MDRKWLVLATLFLTTSALAFKDCADFGQQAEDWVNNHAREYSEKLARADYEVRWKHHFLKKHEAVAHQLTFASRKLAQVYEVHEKATSKAAPTAKKSGQNAIDHETLATLLEQSAAAKWQYKQLVQAQLLLDGIKQGLESFAATCSREIFNESGMAAVGRFSVMDSFLGMAARAKNANDKRFAIEVRFIYETDGNGDNIDTEKRSATEDLKDFIRGALLVYNNLFAFFNKKEIEEQTDKALAAIDNFYRKVLSPDELYVLSKDYCETTQAQYEQQEDAANTNYAAVVANWRQLFRASALVLAATQKELKPFRIRFVQEKLGVGGKEIQAIFDEELRFQVQEEIIELVADKNALASEEERANDPASQAKAMDAYADALLEISGLVAYLIDIPEFLPIRHELQKTLTEVNTEIAVLPWVYKPQGSNL